MFKTIKRYGFSILLCICLLLLVFQGPIEKFLSILRIRTVESIAFAQAARSFTVHTVQESSYAINPHAAIDDNGYIYVTYEDYDTTNGDHIAFEMSTDSAQSFGGWVMVETASRWNPRIAVNNVQDAYVIHTALTSTTYYAVGFKSTHPGGVYDFGTPKLDRSEVAELYGTSYVGQHDIGVENVSGLDNVYAITEDLTGASGSAELDCAYSTDEGESWTAVTLNDSTPARYPAVAVKKSEEDHVYVAWVHSEENNFRVMFDYSTDGGATWSADTTVSDESTVEPYRPGLSALKDPTGTSWVFATWSASASGIKNIYFSYATSSDYTSWAADINNPRGNSQYLGYDQDQPSIAAVVDAGKTSPHLYVAWRDSRDNYIYFQEATWDGSQFDWGIDIDGDGTVSGTDEEGLDMRVSSSASGSEENPTVLAGSNGEVYVVWRDTGGFIKAARYGKFPSSSEPGAPSAPTGVSATAGSGSVTLDWNDNTEADLSYYTVYRGTTRGTYSSLGTSTVSAYTDGSVTNGTVYWYVVTAYDTDGNQSGYSKDVHATPQATGGDTTVPSKPTGLTATAGDTEVGLNWNENSESDLSVYHVYRATTAGANYYSYVTETSSSTTNYVDTGLTNGTTYYYVVTAIDTNNNESPDSDMKYAMPYSGAEIESGAPSAPTNLTATGGNGFVSLDWSDNSEADLSNYKVYRGTSRGSYTVYVSSVAASLYTDNGVTNGTLYWYVVTAVDTDSNESGYSNEAHATPNTTDTTKPNAPTNLTATGSEDRISLSWTASTSSDVSSYHIYRSATSAGAYYHLSYNSSTTYDDTNLTLGTTRYYVVTAVDTSNNESSDSNEASATVSVSAPEAAPDSEEGEVGGPGGGCFIATASYGSPLANEVRALSGFRDNCLFTNSPGRAFVRVYYRVSPPFARFIREKPLIRTLLRIQLKPLVKIASFLMKR